MGLALARIEAGNAGTVAPVEGEAAAARQHVVFAVANMNCGGCMRKIERVLGEQPGLGAVRTNLSAKRVAFEVLPGGPDTASVVDVLARAGFEAAELADPAAGQRTAADRDLMRRLAVAGFATANIMLLSVSVWSGGGGDMAPEIRHLFHWISALIAVPAVAYAGQPFFRSALTALKARRLNMDVPISLGVLLATAMSIAQTIRGTEQVYFDASVSLVFFLLIGRVLDHGLRSRATGAAENLLGLKAGFATLVHADGRSERVAARMIEPGMRLLVAAGERIAADGRIVQGRSDLDEQLMTGETVPRAAGVGDQVYAGTIALTAPIEIVATAADDQTLIAEIARLMQAAEQSKSVYVRLADRAAALYAPVVHALGAATFVGWMVAGAGVETALTTAIAVLIITCPCALALAVPAVQVAAVSRLFGQGVIVTSADGLERMADADTLVLDKTGTLTLGEPRLLNGDQISDAALATAASLGVNSRHPYARAVVRAALDRGVSFAARSGVTEVPGCGLEAASSETSCVEVATVARLGSARWVLGAAAAETPAPETATAPTLWLQTSAASAPVAFAFEDALREDAAHVVNQARRAGLDVLLLSGDRRATVEQAAAAAGITSWRAEQKPADKIAVLDELKASGRHVLMVGDGLNDAPALAAAYASLAMSNAVAVSQIAADGIVQGQRLEPVLQTIAMARRARGLSLSNFGIAAAYNAIFIPVAMAGFVTPLIAALAMSASSILVTANALRLRRAQLTLPPVRTRRTAP